MATRPNTTVYSLIAIGCGLLVLFAIATTIVLALIPLYLPTKNVTPASIYAYDEQVTFSLPIPNTVPTGPLNDSDRARLTQTLEASQTAFTKARGTINVTSAEIAQSASGTTIRKRRQESTNFVILVILITAENRATATLIDTLLRTFLLDDAAAIIALVEALVTGTSSTSTSATVTSENSTGQGSTGQGSTGQGSTGQGSTGQGSTGQGSTGQGSTNQTTTTNTLTSTIPLNPVTTTIPPNLLSTIIPPNLLSSTVPPNLLSTTVPPNLVSTTIPTNMLSSTLPVRRRRKAYQESSTEPLVTYKD